MKRLLFLLALAMPLLWMGCDDDNDDLVEDNVLRYDGENFTAPLLPPGTSEMAVRFTPTITGDYVGRTLEEVTFWVEEIPEKLEIIIYDQGAPALPGVPLYTQEVTNSVQAQRWFTHVLSTPIEITGEDIWISTRITADAQGRFIGCDNGPNQTNGDWMFLPTDNQWLPFSVRVNESVNWNIRGILNEE